jgi:hypothetical protein
LLEKDPAFTGLVKEAVNREVAKPGLREVEEGGDLQIATTGMERIGAARRGVLFTTPSAVHTVGRYNK